MPNSPYANEKNDLNDVIQIAVADIGKELRASRVVPEVAPATRRKIPDVVGWGATSTMRGHQGGCACSVEMLRCG